MFPSDIQNARIKSQDKGITCNQRFNIGIKSPINVELFPEYGTQYNRAIEKLEEIFLMNKEHDNKIKN